MKKTLGSKSKLKIHYLRGELDQPEKVRRDKGSNQYWYQNGVRMDLNSLITKITKQNELLERLTEKIDCLSEAVIKFHSKPGKI